MKRAATASGDISEKLYIRQEEENGSSVVSDVRIEVNDEPHVDAEYCKDEDVDGYRTSNEEEEEEEDDDEDDTVADDSPFDRSYFRFENEDSDEGRSSPAHIGGRALDAVVVSRQV